MSETKFTPGPWFIRDFRASEMRRLGWTGPAIDRILIVNKTGPEITKCEGDDCVIARIQFDNRPEELGDGNFADAALIASAPDLYLALEAALSVCEYVLSKPEVYDANFAQLVHAHVDFARAALARARGDGK